MEQQQGSGRVRPGTGDEERAVLEAFRLMHPEEITALARRALESGDGGTALTLQEVAARRMASMIGAGEMLARRRRDGGIVGDVSRALLSRQDRA